MVVDARDSARRLFHATLAIPVQAGPLTLVYPRWGIPTYELPAAALNNIVRLKISGNGKPIEWRRDLVDMFSFHVVVPDDVDTLHVAMDVVAPAERSDLNAATAQLFVLDWYTLILYPLGSASNNLQVDASLRLPAGWKYGCGIAAAKVENDIVDFPRMSLSTLVDSPVLAGKYFKEIDLHPKQGPPVYADIAADSAEVAELSQEWQERLRRVIAEAGALFGGYPYREYHFLLSLSDELGNDGLEHHQSADIRMSLRSFVNDDNRLAYGYLLPHEYVHSWNGKYRIPSGIVRGDFQQSQTTELLWVYEGLTRYLNWVLAARSGVLTLPEARDYAALLAAQTASRSGREWRSLQDTAISTRLLIEAPAQWQSLRRGVDYYDEAFFIWLEVDTIIRRTSGGKHSLDDFCRTFFRPSEQAPTTKPYTFDELTKILNGISPHDWKEFFQTRLNATGTNEAPLGGLSASGWDLAYRDSTNSVEAARDRVHRTIEERFTSGVLLQEDGTIIDVVRDSPGWNAGLGPGMKIVSLNGHPWSAQIFRDAIRATASSSAPLSLSLQNGTETFGAVINDHRGELYPRLERNSAADLMGDILSPITAKVRVP